MLKKGSMALAFLALFFPLNLALAGGTADFDATVIQAKGERVIFGNGEGISRSIHFCGPFAGKLYYGDRLIPAGTDMLNAHGLPLYSSVHFSGGINGGEEKEKNSYSYCLGTELLESEIRIMTEEYQVNKGESLWKILRKKGGNPYDYHTIATLNHLENPHALKIGQMLTLPVYKK